jgi:hypothetical protein
MTECCASLPRRRPEQRWSGFVKADNSRFRGRAADSDPIRGAVQAARRIGYGDRRERQPASQSRRAIGEYARPDCQVVHYRRRNAHRRRTCHRQRHAGCCPSRSHLRGGAIFVGPPVGSAEACNRLRTQVDDLVCLVTPERFFAAASGIGTSDKSAALRCSICLPRAVNSSESIWPWQPSPDAAYERLDHSCRTSRTTMKSRTPMARSSTS